jgi:hypothetical protein
VGDDMSKAARVLAVCERASDAEALASALRSFDLEVLGSSAARAREAARARLCDAVVLSEVNLSPCAISRLAVELKAGAQPRLLVVIAVGGRLDPAHLPQGVDAALAAAAHPAQIAARLELLVRLAVMVSTPRAARASTCSTSARRRPAFSGS